MKFRCSFQKIATSACFASLLAMTGSLQAETLSTATVFPVMAPRLSSNFGVRKHPILNITRHHSGVDLAAPEEAHVRSVRAGTVVFAGEHGAYGKLITVLHENGYASLYGHLKTIEVKLGQKLAAGEVIGRVGQSGMATGPHLHFEWRKDGKAQNPVEVFPSLTTRAEG